MVVRVKLCAIAKNEGPYLADWVFHHLYFGFDAVEVWVNGTDDPSPRILRALRAAHPQVTWRNADRMLAACLAAGKSFQYRAYARMARRASEEGYSHVAFLDLDEYWLPRDLRTGLAAFVPPDPEVNVVSFPWCTDVPDLDREPFAPPLSRSLRVQLDRHVKSVVRLDDSVRQFRTHTARTHGGVRLLVRDPFPMADEREQQWGSLVPHEHWTSHWDRLPEAFVLHLLNRSPLEYVAGLGQGLRQTGKEVAFKTNRYGFLPAPGPELDLVLDRESLEAYRRGREDFLRAVEIEQPVRRARRQAAQRAAALLERLDQDADARGLLADALRGVPVAEVRTAASTG